MGSKYHHKFSGKSTSEGSKELLSAVEAADTESSKLVKKTAYESGYMISGGHAMTSVEIIRKD